MKKASFLLSRTAGWHRNGLRLHRNYYILLRFGRRPTCMLVFVITGTAATIVGIVQYIDTDRRDSLTNGFAMVSNFGIAMGWSSVQTMTIETYPTVVRNIGFGFCSVLTRVAAAVGPQLVLLDMYVPGILYFICGGLSVGCICALIWLPETKDSNLNDKINQVIEHKVSQKESNREET